MDNFKAQNENRDQNRDFVIEDGALVKYNGSGGDVVIPDHVVAIEQCVFAYRDDLVSVTLPNALRYIGQEAFCGCENLKEVKVSENESPEAQISPVPPEEAWIVDAAFMFCKNLTSVAIPKGITGIDTAVFMNCPKLSSLTVPETVTYIDKSAFYNMAPLPADKADDDAGRENGEGDFFVRIMIGIMKEPTKPIIYGSVGSYAEQFAKENSMIFKEI